MGRPSFWYRFSHHLSTITRHKLKVQGLCFKLGLYSQGLKHDLSKYSIVEFWSGVKYYQGDRSPIDAEKRELGYSLGWLHHKGRNKHHWEYWLDKDASGIFCVKIPDNYMLEMLCDRVAACKIYQKDKYTDASAYEYFENGLDRGHMHPDNVKMLDEMLLLIKNKGEKEAFKIIKARYRK